MARFVESGEVRTVRGGRDARAEYDDVEVLCLPVEGFGFGESPEVGSDGGPVEGDGVRAGGVVGAEGAEGCES